MRVLNVNAIYVTVGMVTACLLILSDMECGNWPVFLTLQIDIPLLITGKIMRVAAAHFHTCLKAKEKCKGPPTFSSSLYLHPVECYLRRTFCFYF